MEPLLQKESLFWHQSGAIFEWIGSELCELYSWILLVEQSAQISYMILAYYENYGQKSFITLGPEAIFLVVCDPSMNELDP